MRIEPLTRDHQDFAQRPQGLRHETVVKPRRAIADHTDQSCVSNYTQLLALGWRGGSVLSHELLQGIQPQLTRGREAPPAVDGNCWAIVISQTCDLVALKDEAEPYVEILLARVSQEKKPRTQFVDRRSTRYLDFRPNRALYPERILTAHASANRYSVPRAALLAGPPDPGRVLSDTAVQGLQAWFALRAQRPAWPDAFGRRIQAQRTELEKALQPVREDLAEVRVAIQPRDAEQVEGQAYTTLVMFVMKAADHADEALRRNVTGAFQAFVAALSKCSGIEIHELSAVVSGDDFSREETRSTDLWDFAYLSPYE